MLNTTVFDPVPFAFVADTVEGNAPARSGVPETSPVFGSTLKPILQAIGVDPGAPEITPVHKVLAG